MKYKFKALSLLFPIKKAIEEEKEFVADCGGSHHNTTGTGPRWRERPHGP